MNKPISLVDLDGTLADYTGQLEQDLALIAGPNDPVVNWRRDGMPDWLDRRRKLITNQPGWFAKLPCYQPGFDLLGLAEAIGFECQILTHGPRTNRLAWTDKAIWCDRHVPGRPVHVVSDKSLAYGRVLIDDWPPYFLPWLEHRPRGLVIAPAHPWNEGITHPNVIRYTGDADRAGVIERLTRAAHRKDGED